MSSPSPILAALWAKAPTDVQATVIDSIASGDPDFRQILGLLSADPRANWASDKVVEKAEPAKVDYSGFEMLTRSRFIDLRRWRESEAAQNRQGNAFVRERLTIKRLETSSALSRLGIRVGHSSRIADDAVNKEVPHVQEVCRPAYGSGT